MKNFENPKKAEMLKKIVTYLVEEDFPQEHLEALRKIICVFNWSKESEKEIFELSEKLYKKYK